MTFTEDLSQAGRLVQDGGNTARILAHDAWQLGAKAYKTAADNPVETAVGIAAVGSLVIFHKPLGSAAGGLLGGLRRETAAETAESFQITQFVAGLTEKGAPLKVGDNLVRIRSGLGIREYEAHVPPNLASVLPNGDKAAHPVAMVFDTVLIGARKGEIPYANLSKAGLPPNGMPGNGFHRICDENGIIGIFPVPQRDGLLSGWSKALKFVGVDKDVKFAHDILADLPQRAPVELAAVHTADSVPLASVHLAGMSGGGSFVRTLISEGVMPPGTIKSALMVAAPRFSNQGAIQSGIDTMITHGQPKSIASLKQLAALDTEGVSKPLLDALPKTLGRGDTVVRYEGGPGIETRIAGALLRKSDSLADSKPYLLFHDAAKANGIDSAAVIPDTSNPFFVRRAVQAADGTKVEETLLAQPFDGHNFAGRPTVTTDGKAVSSRYRISDLHGPVAPASTFSTIERWLEFTGLRKAP